MAIKYSSDLKWGNIYYIKTDPDQAPYSLVGILLTPGKPKLKLKHNGYAKATVYESEVTTERNITMLLDPTIGPNENPDDEE